MMLINCGMAGKNTPQFRRDNLFKKWRKFRGLTLEEAAEKADMTAGNLSAMERGSQGFSDVGLYALAKAYNCSPADLLNVDPTRDKSTIWSIWESATDNDRKKIVDIAKTIVGQG